MDRCRWGGVRFGSFMYQSGFTRKKEPVRDVWLGGGRRDVDGFIMLVGMASLKFLELAGSLERISVSDLRHKSFF
jgi:hypothetical protein